MQVLDALLQVLQPDLLLLVFAGTAAGIFAGAIPGISGGMTLALALPLTFHMSGVEATVLIVSLYVGVVTGGFITAIVLNIPGTVNSIATAYDGFPMARRGEAGRALGLGMAASFTGCVVSWIFLVLLAPPLARIALAFDHFDYFAMVIMALVFISTLSEGSMIKAMIAGLLGMLLALPGIDPVSARLRLDFGIPEMASGFQMLPVLISLFGISQILSDTVGIDQKTERLRFSDSILPKLQTLRRQAGNALRSSVIGTWIGILPGIGGAIGSFVSYSVARNLSKEPERFGTGIDDGIVASEAANNATVGGALVPLITLGIPGSIGDVILLAALIMHGVTPGPMLFQNNPEIAWGVIGTMLVASFAILAIMLVAIPWIARVVNVSKVYIIPAVFVLSIAGAFAINNSMFDVWVMLGAGLLGFAMLVGGLPLGPFALGFILAPLAETSLRAGLMASQGSFLPLIERPTTLLFLGAALLTFCWPFWRNYQMRRAALLRGGTS